MGWPKSVIYTSSISFQVVAFSPFLAIPKTKLEPGKAKTGPEFSLQRSNY